MDRYSLLSRLDQFGYSHGEMAVLLFADGSVKLTSPSVSPEVLKAISTPDGGEAISDF
ncbi:hypothetical protein [Thalassoglobus polymorphus]|uniref:hypothetical protein n=1 Tax=Thalassoglobus polymorphus TaxID=2527994 RepID=UPI001E2C6035|nr:hypothetical protein [Thalassoglobus polymorphus]